MHRLRLHSLGIWSILPVHTSHDVMNAWSEQKGSDGDHDQPRVEHEEPREDFPGL